MKIKIKKRRQVFSIGLFFVFSFFFGYQAFVRSPGQLEQTLAVAAYPFITSFNAIAAPFVHAQNFFKGTNQLIQDLDLLRKENDELRAELVASKSSEGFLEDTQELREFKDRYDAESMCLSHIIFKQFDIEHFFLIDAGKQKNIQKNTAVVYRNCLIGKVTEVYPFYSKVTLITDPSCQVASYCAKTKAAGIYHGTKKLDEASLAYVDHIAALEVGDQVLSSGEGLVFPRGFGIAQVVSFQDTGVHYAVTVKPLIDVTKLSYCYVLQGGIKQEVDSPQEQAPALS